MPQNTRNFWIEILVDGKKTKIATGPVAKDGGFILTIKIRQDGAVSQDELYLDGIVHDDGTLSIKASTRMKGFIGNLLHGRR